MPVHAAMICSLFGDEMIDIPTTETQNELALVLRMILIQTINNKTHTLKPDQANLKTLKEKLASKMVGEGRIAMELEDKF